MKRSLVALLVALAILGGAVSASTQESGSGLLVVAMEVDYYLPESDPELGLEKLPGEACIFMTEEWRPSMVVIENQDHQVISVWPMVGTIVDAEQGPICTIEEGTSIPLPEANFYLVYRDDEMVGAYSPETLPVNQEWALPLVVNLGYGED